MESSAGAPGAPGGWAGGSGNQPHVVVLGAGVCGLYAGHVLAAAGVRVTVLERESVVGGLAAGREIGGNYYDLGTHHLHAFDREIYEDIHALMGERLIAVEKSAKIKHGRGYRRYPLQFADLLLGIPPWTLARCVAGLAVQKLAGRLGQRQPVNAEEALIQLYGRPLYAYFFRDFTARYWGMPPTELSATFVRRKMPRLSAVDIVKKALAPVGLRDRAGTAVDSALRDEVMFFSPTGSREMPMALADQIRRSGGAVRTDCHVTGIETDGPRVMAVHFTADGEAERLACDYVISTIPVTALAGAFDPPAPEPVRAAAGRIGYMPLAVYGLLVRRERVLGALYIYFRDRIFHRVSEPSASGMQVLPAGHTVLLVEATCQLGDDTWNGDEAIRRQILEDLEAEGLLEADEVVETHLVRSEHAYPVFALGFEPHYEALRHFIDGFSNLESTGRQGAFCYPNMHAAMRMGAEAAEDAVKQLVPGAPSAGPAAAEV